MSNCSTSLSVRYVGILEFDPDSGVYSIQYPKFPQIQEKGTSQSHARERGKKALEKVLEDLIFAGQELPEDDEWIPSDWILMVQEKNQCQLILHTLEIELEFESVPFDELANLL